MYQCHFCKRSFKSAQARDTHYLRQSCTSWPFDEVVAGDIVELVSMHDDPDPIAPGTKGTVVGKSSSSLGNQVWVRWWDGRSLNLMEADEFVIVGREYEIMEVP